MNNYELSWTEQFCKEDLVSKIDEYALQIDRLNYRLHEEKVRASLYERMYNELVSKIYNQSI